MSRLPITDDDVHAWADRQLPPDRKTAFEQAMERDPALVAKVGDIERQNAWLRGGLDPLLHEPLPERLIDAARMPATSWRAHRWLAPVAASVATLLIGLAGG